MTLMDKITEFENEARRLVAFLDLIEEFLTEVAAFEESQYFSTKAKELLKNYE